MALVHVLDFYVTECLGSFVDDPFALRTENVCGTPDGNTDLDLFTGSGL
jgi:hypothetical protein